MGECRPLASETIWSCFQKADVVTGLAEGQAEEITNKDPKWMINGEWGLIQMCPKQE